MPATVIFSGHLIRWSTVSNLTHFLWISNESNSFSCDFYFSNFLSNIKGSCDVRTIKGSISNNCVWKSQLRPSCFVHPGVISFYRNHFYQCIPANSLTIGAIYLPADMKLCNYILLVFTKQEVDVEKKL